MTSRLALALLVGLAIFCGCTVSSLSPIYTEKDVIFRPELVGTWQGEKEDDLISFTRVKDSNGYVLSFEEDKQEIRASAHLCTIHSKMYLDLTIPDDFDEKKCTGLPFLTPIHMFYMVELKDNTLRMRSMNSSWAEERREKHRLGIAYKENGDATLLTADTARVQRFLRQWENDPRAWGDWIEAKRVPPAASK